MREVHVDAEGRRRITERLLLLAIALSEVQRGPEPVTRDFKTVARDMKPLRDFKTAAREESLMPVRKTVLEENAPNIVVAFALGPIGSFNVHGIGPVDFVGVRYWHGAFSRNKSSWVREQYSVLYDSQGGTSITTIYYTDEPQNNVLH